MEGVSKQSTEADLTSRVSEQADAAEVTQSEEAKKYLEAHKIPELLENMTAQLVFHQPDNPREFMVNLVGKLKDARDAAIEYPSLFEESNLESVFGILDPTGRGYISTVQYKHALESLGMKDFNQDPDGSNDDRIELSTFIGEAKLGLMTSSATFKQ